MGAPLFGIGAGGSPVLSTFPTAYHIQLFGDSLSDFGSLGGTNIAYSMGQELIGHTSKLGSVTEFAAGGKRLDEIAVTFGNQFDAADRTYNAIFLGGGHNDLAQDTAIATMKASMVAMADAVTATGRHYLIIVNIPPWGDNSNWSAARQAVLEEYNAWLAVTYPAYMVDIYTPLNNGTADFKLLPDYFRAAQESHPINAGCRKVDEVVGKQLLYTESATDLTVPPLNTLPDYRDLTTWTDTVHVAAGTHGGSVLCADGTYSSEKGVVALSTSAVEHKLRKNAVAADNHDTIRATFYLRSGNVNTARVNLQDGDNNIHAIYVDIKAVTLGTQTDAGDETAVWTIEKAAYGWVKVQGTVVNSDAAPSVIQVQVISTKGETPTYAAIVADSSAEIYVDGVSLEDLGVV